MLKAQLHSHSMEDRMDGCLKYSAKGLIDDVTSKGFEVLAFTFHDQFFYPDELVEYAASKNVLLIPGVEMTIEGKHVLVYGVKEKPSINTFEELRKLDNVLIVAPHPYFPRHHSLNDKLLKNIDIFDAIEHSSIYLSYLNYNKRAVRVAKKFNKTLLGMADVHNIDLVDKTYSLIDAEKTVSGVIKAIKEGKVEVVSKPLKLSFMVPYLFQMFRPF